MLGYLSQHMITQSKYQMAGPPAYFLEHILRTPNEGINQRELKKWADVADKICFSST